jgi:hypothetical protein
MTFAARKEPWLLPVLVIDGLVMLGIAVWLFLEAGQQDDAVLAMAGVAILLGLPFTLWILLGVRYQITETELVTRIGPFVSRIPLAQIDEVFPTKGNPLSPAWAQDRLQVMYRMGDGMQVGVMNPEDRTGFLQRLAAADPALRLEGEKVQRRYA